MCSTDVNIVVENVHLERRRKILEWLGGDNTRHEELTKSTVDNSGQWFLSSAEYAGWVNGTNPQCLFCIGIRLNPFLFVANILLQPEQGNQF